MGGGGRGGGGGGGGNPELIVWDQNSVDIVFFEEMV